jgi:hypothetical protein
VGFPYRTHPWKRIPFNHESTSLAVITILRISQFADEIKAFDVSKRRGFLSYIKTVDYCFGSPT